MKKLFFAALLFASSLLPFAANAASADPEQQKLVDETLAKARAYLGSDAKLDAVRSVRFTGVLVYGNGDSGTVDIVYKKPQHQQIVSVINGLREVSTLKRTEAWRKIERYDRPGSWELNLYETNDILRMQANVRDLFDFMKVPSARVGKVTYEGEQEIDGVMTRALRFDHGSGIFFIKYIDPATGRLNRSVNDLGMVFVPTGEKMVDGVRFPEKLVTRFLTPLGVESLELTYSGITLNEDIDNARFDVPLMTD